MVGRAMLRSSTNKHNVTAKNTKAITSKKPKATSDENNVKQQGRLKPKVGEKTKRDAESSPKEAPAKKRSVFGDITNAGNRVMPFGGKKTNVIPKKAVTNGKPKTKVCKRTRSQGEVEKVVKVQEEKICEEISISSGDKSANSSSFENISVSSLLSDTDFGKISSDGLPSSQDITVSSSYTTADETDLLDSLKENDAPKDKASCSEPIVIKEQAKALPEGVRDVDTDQDPFAVSEYAESIFKNMKAKEEMFKVRKYMEDRQQLTPAMRAILIDWLVEVQENFELYHETLYLAVRIVDLYLQENEIDKHKLQLIGATAMLIASKIEERYPPPLDDFVFICDDAYVASDFIKAELDILKVLKFELGIPISYRFLRRYSRVAGAAMEVLTLARYILESSLLHYEYVDCSPSKMASAALLLSFKMKKCCEWDSTLVYHTGFREDELKELVISLNKMISEPPKATLNTVRSKYSHPVFSEVAKIPPLEMEKEAV